IFFFQAEDGIRDRNVTGVQTCALPIYLDQKVEKYDQAIEASENVSERKELRSARKKPKQDRKALQDYIVRKQKYQNDMLIFDGRNSYSKTDHDATFMRMKDDYMR